MEGKQENKSGHSKKIRIMLVDDHKMFREGIFCMLNAQADMTVVGETESGENAVRLSRELKPNIVLMDISLKDLDGMEATRRIVAESPEVKVVALSMHDGKGYVRRMMRAGACGYLMKDCNFKELLNAIRAVAEGKAYLCPGVAGIMIVEYMGRGTNGSSSSKLTDREREVLQLIADGVSTRKIAANLKVSTKTVETHRRQIMKKLDIFNVALLTKFAVREGLTSIEN